ncbi:hypothetical protein protein [Bacillus cereus G9241]|nr:hypothetical protein protein [Bacillus cereus G9241]
MIKKQFAIVVVKIAVVGVSTWKKMSAILDAKLINPQMNKNRTKMLSFFFT